MWSNQGLKEQTEPTQTHCNLPVKIRNLNFQQDTSQLEKVLTIQN
jgi:hypothetical protein